MYLTVLLILSLLYPYTSAHPTSTVNTTTTNSTTTGSTSYQATLTGYGGNCGGQVGSCGFLGTQGSYQAAVSAYWNQAGLPGQCGTCWQISNATFANSDGTKAGPIGTAPIVVMVDNTCAYYAADPTGSCSQGPDQLTDRWGSVVGVDLCHDTGAPQALWGDLKDGQTGGLAVATITQVDCGQQWKGEAEGFVDWRGYQASPGGRTAVIKKPA